MLWISVLQWEKKQGTRYAFNHLSHFFHPCIDTIHKAEAEKGRSFVHFSLCSTNAHCCILIRSVQPILWNFFTKNDPHVFCAGFIIVVIKVSTHSFFFFEQVAGGKIPVTWVVSILPTLLQHCFNPLKTQDFPGNSTLCGDQEYLPLYWMFIYCSNVSATPITAMFTS